MSIIKNASWIFGALILLACQRGATCAELGKYVFTATPASFEVTAGNSYTLEMIFYPVPARRMRFSDEISRHAFVGSNWNGWESGNQNPENLPKTQISVIGVSAETPLQFNLQFKSERIGQSLILDFGRTGKLRDVPIGENIPLKIVLRPMAACLVDSGEDYALAEFTIETY